MCSCLKNKLLRISVAGKIDTEQSSGEIDLPWATVGVGKYNSNWHNNIVYLL